jgi:HSP20 family molecular chaperone IbpA
MLLNMLNDRDLEWFFKTPFSDQTKVARYPLTNLGVDEDKNLRIEVAVAGFSKDDIEVEVKGYNLVITGEKKVEEESTINYLQQNISNTAFKRIVVMHDDYVGGDIDANVENGILTINVTPKEQQRKLISIN